MKTRFKTEIIRPFALQLSKRSWHISIDGPMSDSNRWFNEESVFKKWYMIAGSIGHKQLIPILNFLIIVI